MYDEDGNEYDYNNLELIALKHFDLVKNRCSAGDYAGALIVAQSFADSDMSEKQKALLFAYIVSDIDEQYQFLDKEMTINKDLVLETDEDGCVMFNDDNDSVVENMLAYKIYKYCVTNSEDFLNLNQQKGDLYEN